MGKKNWDKDSQKQPVNVIKKCDLVTEKEGRM